MKLLASAALVMVAVVLAAAAPALARGGAGHGVAGGPGAFEGNHGFEGDHPEGFEGHHGFEDYRGADRDGYGRRSGSWYDGGFADPYTGDGGAVDPYVAPPPAGYYCSSAGHYYPDVTSCPEGWMPVEPLTP